MRSLEGDGLERRTLSALAFLGLLGVWCIWATCGKVSLYATTPVTRLEVTQMVHAVEAPVGGRISSVSLTLDRVVAANEILVVLDTSIVTQKRVQAIAQRDALGPRLSAAERELAQEREVQKLYSERTDVAVASARARAAEAHAAARTSAHASARAEKMKDADVGSTADLENAKGVAQQRSAQAWGAAVDVKRQKIDSRLDHSRSLAHVAELERGVAELEGQLKAAAAQVEALDKEIEQHVLRAPVAGRLGDVAKLQVGSVLQIGSRVATIVPDGDLRAVAEFPPAEAVGRIEPGQMARIRLDGYPWTQYGALSAQVVSVGSEPRDGKIRVELWIDRASATSLPLRHGMPGSTEVETGKVAPFAILLRGMSDVVPKHVTPSQAIPVPMPSPTATGASAR